MAGWRLWIYLPFSQLQRWHRRPQREESTASFDVALCNFLNLFWIQKQRRGKAAINGKWLPTRGPWSLQTFDSPKQKITIVGRYRKAAFQTACAAMIWSSSGYWVNMEGWLLENPCLCPVWKGPGVHRKASEYQGGQECLIKTVEDKEDWLASATDTHSHNHQCSAKDATGRRGCLSNLTPLIRQVGLGSRQGPSGNASALICRDGQGSISTTASVCNCLDRPRPLL